MHQLILKHCLNVFGIFAMCYGWQSVAVSQFLQQKALCQRKLLGRSVSWLNSSKFVSLVSRLIIIFKYSWRSSR